MQKGFSYVLFDLDGTLIQSEFGIIDSAVYALEKCGIAVEDRSTLKKFIGPPVYTSFTEFYGFDEARALQAVAWYREYYEREGVYAAPLYDGVRQMLTELKAAGKKLALVTSKPLEMAEVVLAHHGIRDFFMTVSAPDKKERFSIKEKLTAAALDALGVRDKRDAVMVGDRRFDMEGAKGASIAAIGVLYGYGSAEELLQAGAAALARTPGEVTALCTEGLAAGTAAAQTGDE